MLKLLLYTIIDLFKLGVGLGGGGGGERISLLMRVTYDFSLIGGMYSISYYFRNSSASINNVTNVNYDNDLHIFV